MSSVTSLLQRYAPLLLVPISWELTARLQFFDPTIFPPLEKIASAWLAMVGTGELIWNTGISLYRTAVGLGIAIVAGLALGVGMALVKSFRELVSVPLELLYPLPKSALIPVTAIWLGFGNTSKIVLVALGCVLPVAIAAFNGVKGVDPFLIWSARSMGARGFTVTRDILLPAALPEILNGIRTSLALAFILIVSSELIASREGFGFLIGFLGASGAYASMFAVVLTVAALGFAVDRSFLVLADRMLRWQRL
jgi:NitT/TauT family transport system permease protein